MPLAVSTMPLILHVRRALPLERSANGTVVSDALRAGERMDLVEDAAEPVALNFEVVTSLQVHPEAL